MNAVLRGAAPATAFAPFQVRIDAGLLPKLRRAGVRSVKVLLLELELTFHPRAPTQVMHLNLGVAPWPTPALAQIGLRRLKHEQRHRADRRLSTYTGPGAPLGRVTRAVLAEVRAGRCARLPLVRPAAWTKLLPTRREQADLRRDTDRARRDLPAVCRGLAALEQRRMNLTLDDLTFGALDASGKLVGMLRCDLDWQDRPGWLLVRVGAFFPRR